MEHTNAEESGQLPVNRSGTAAATRFAQLSLSVRRPHRLRSARHPASPALPPGAPDPGTWHCPRASPAHTVGARRRRTRRRTKSDSDTHRRPLLSARPCASVRHAGAPDIRSWYVAALSALIACAHCRRCRTRSLVRRVGTIFEYSSPTASLRPPLCLRPPCRCARYLALARDIVRVRARQR